MTEKKVLVVGAGIIGLNTAKQMLDREFSVDLYTISTKSVSSEYARGITTKPAKADWLSKIYFKMLNYNYIWLISYLIATYINKSFYINYKKYAVSKSIEILKSFGIPDPYEERCREYFINTPIIVEKILGLLKEYENKKKFSIHDKNELTNDEIFEKAKDYHYVFVCKGSNNDEKNYLCEDIGGYKVEIKLKEKLENNCFMSEEGWYLHRSEDDEYKLIVKGGFIIGSSNYNKEIVDKIEKDEITKLIKSKNFWEKYKCDKILHIYSGSRRYSNDMLPFYKKTNDNIYTFTGSSAVGAITGPYVVRSMLDQIIDGKIDKYDFSINRPKTFIKKHLYS